MDSKIIFIDKEEKELSNLIEKGSFTSVNIKKKKELFSLLNNAAKNSKAKRMVVNLRLPKRDLFVLKTDAAKEGIPYQTYIASVLHKHINSKQV